MKSEKRKKKKKKSNAKSIKFLKEGCKEYFEKSDFNAALISYTKSVANAVDGSTEQMLAFGNRSTVLFHLREHIPCLHDVNRVLNLNCSEELKKKMLERKARCLARIKDAASIDADATDPVRVPYPGEETEWTNLCNFDNPLIPNASSKIKIEFDQKWGRHLTATEDIEAGMYI